MWLELTEQILMYSEVIWEDSYTNLKNSFKNTGVPLFSSLVFETI